MAGKSKILLGVCAWIAKKFKLDPTIIRIAFVVFAFLGGSGLLLYLVLWIIKVIEER